MDGRSLKSLPSTSAEVMKDNAMSTRKMALIARFAWSDWLREEASALTKAISYGTLQKSST